MVKLYFGTVLFKLSVVANKDDFEDIVYTGTISRLDVRGNSTVIFFSLEESPKVLL